MIDLETGLIAYYPSDIDFNDHSGNGNDAVATGAVLSDEQVKVGSKSVFTDGLNDYRTVPRTNLPNSFSAMAWAGWYYISAINKFQFLLDREDIKTYFAITNDNRIRFRHSDIGDGQTETGINAVSAGGWVHLGFQWDGSDTEIRIGGIAIGGGESATGTISYAGTKDMILGAREFDKGLPYGGYADEEGLWNRALTNEEWTYLAAGGEIIPSATETVVGIATAIDGGNRDIDISMPYTDDSNTNNTYTVDYKLSADSTYTNWVTASPNTPSPFTDTITGLNNAGIYDVKVTWNDADGVTGTNPQTITDISLSALPNKFIPTTTRNDFIYRVVKNTNVVKVVKKTHISKVVK